MNNLNSKNTEPEVKEKRKEFLDKNEFQFSFVEEAKSKI
jgi:hypothetical protein